MNCTIRWNTLKIAEWEQRFSQVRRAGLLQSYPYAKALCRLKRQTARWGLIEIDDQEAGLVQMIEASAFGGLLQAVIIDRGPLWFESYGNAAHFKAFAEVFDTQFPKRFGRRRRFIPEMGESPDIEGFLQEKGFQKTVGSAYQTTWLDLRESEENLRQNLKKNWRGSLNKAERANVTLDWDDQGQHLPWLLKAYSIDKQQKNYDGPSVTLLQALAKPFIAEKNLIIGRVLIDHKPIAAILILCHGLGATYQIGWTSPQGRENSAHHLLLWNALKILKDKGIKDFDLGGVNDNSATGIKKFKTGMGGELVRLAGLYT